MACLPTHPASAVSRDRQPLIPLYHQSAHNKKHVRELHCILAALFIVRWPDSSIDGVGRSRCRQLSRVGHGSSRCSRRPRSARRAGTCPVRRGLFTGRPPERRHAVRGACPDGYSPVRRPIVEALGGLIGGPRRGSRSDHPDLPGRGGSRLDRPLLRRG